MSELWCPFANRIESPNFGYPRGTHGQLTNPIAVVDHIMAGYFLGCRSWFKNPASWASSTFGVSMTGIIDQYVSLYDCAWANGAVFKPDPIAAIVTTGQNPNVVTWSIEHEGYPEDLWTEAMYQADLKLKKWLWEQKSGLILIGHCHIDSVNKSNCPGPNWPRERLLADLEVNMGSGLSQISENWVKAIAREEASKVLKDARLTALFKHPDGRIFQRVGGILFRIPDPAAFVGSGFDWDDAILTPANDPLWKSLIVG